MSQEIPFADAAIYRLSDTEAMVQSLDFFTPVVNDPYSYGQIAAANSLSDVFAVGARPLTAMNIVCFPINCLDPDVLVKILQGGAERVHAAGAVMAGGHSIEDDEPKYGLSVTGIVDPGCMMTTCGGKVGDQLYLTKPLGTGLLTTALKGEMVTEEDISEAIEGMKALNKGAAEAMMAAGASACTDITGFGLVGHASEMADASQVGMKISLSQLPVYSGAVEMAEMGLVPIGAHRNKDYYFSRVINADSCDPIQLDLLCDPQTSGGLLISVPEERAELLEQELSSRAVPVCPVGELIDGPIGTMTLVP